MKTSTHSHRAPVPEEEPLPDDAPPQQDEPSPHPDPVVQVMRGTDDSLRVICELPNRHCSTR